MSSLLSISEPDSCLPTAVNYYFGRPLFTSLSEFTLRQTKKCLGRFRAELEVEFRLASQVQVGLIEYRLVCLYTSARICKGDWKSQRGSKSVKRLVFYQTDSSDVWHAEAVRVESGRVVVLRTQKVLLPYANITLDQYVAEAERGCAYRHIWIGKYIK